MSSLPKTWDDDVVTDYIKQESQQKSPEIFLETHIPIRKIRAESLTGYGGGDFISERKLLEHILSRSNPDSTENRIYLLKGEVGSGKSHLCQWLEYQLNGQGDRADADDHVAIHISRNNTRLSDILDKLYEHIDAEYDELDDITALDAESLANFIIAGLETFDASNDRFAGHEFDLKAFIRDYEKKLDLRTVLEDNIRDYQEAVEDEDREQRIELITREEFGRVCINVFGRSFKDSDVFPIIRNSIHERLMANIGIVDFKKQLISIADQYQKEGKRPVLICEDVTTFTVLKDDFMDHVFQLGDGGEEMHSGFDVILGYTTGWESEKADDALTTGDLSHMTQRADGYLWMTNDDGEAYFLEEGAMPVQLVEKYVEVIKEHSDFDDDALPDVDEEAFDGVYPFNERFIVRAYKHLEENGKLQQTPRLLLYHVIGDCLLSSVPPYEQIEGNTYVREFAAPTSVGNYSRSFQELVKWYGRMDDGWVVVPETYFETFDVEIPDDVHVQDGYVRLEVLFEDIGWEVPSYELEPVVDDDGDGSGSDGDDSDLDGGNEGSTEGESGGRDDGGNSGRSSGGRIGGGNGGSDGGDEEKQSERARQIAQFRSWYGGGGEFPSANRLREGVQTALNRFHDPTRLANENATTDGTAGFYYASGSDVPVEIRGPDASKDIAVPVSHVDDGVAEYERMLYDLMLYGVEGEFRDEVNFDAIRAWTDDEVVDFRTRMRDDLESCLPEMTLEEFLVLARFLLLNGAQGDDELTREALLRGPEGFAVPDTSPFTWDESSFDVPQSLKEGYNKLTTRRTDIAKLSQGFFLLKKNYVDYDRLQPAMRAVTENLDEYIDAAARISASDLKDGYRVGTTRNNATGSTRAKELFRIVSDYANELQKLQLSFDVSTIEDDVDGVRTLYSMNHTAEDLRDAYVRLRDSIKPLDVNFRERWEPVGDLLENRPEELELGAFGDTLSSFEDVDPETGVEAMSLMYEYNESRATNEGWAVYETLGEMIEVLENHEDADADEFRTIVQNTPIFLQLKSARNEALDTLGGI